MITNCNVTLYNKFMNKTTLKEEYKRTFIKGASWQESEVKTIANNTLLTADSIKIRIPLSSDFQNKAYIEPKAWNKLLDSERDNYFTFQGGDRIVKGECDYIYSSTNLISKLDSNYDNVATIMSIKVNDFGSKALQHYYLGAK